MKVMGLIVEEAQFFAGHLKSTTGEAVSIAAGRRAQDTSLVAAERVVDSSSFLSNPNISWGKNTIRLHLAKSIWNSLLDAGLRILVASALARDAGAGRAVMLVVRPHDFPRSHLIDVCSNLELRFYSPGFGLNRTGQLYLLLWLLRGHFTELKWRMEARVHQFLSRRRSSVIADADSPSVLLMQEAEISLHRSYRAQPHWLFENETTQPPFQFPASIDRWPCRIALALAAPVRLLGGYSSFRSRFPHRWVGRKAWSSESSPPYLSDMDRLGAIMRGS